MELSAPLPAKARRIFAKVSRMIDEADGIRSYELVSLDASPLPRFTAGAHLDISVPLLGERHYSLTNCSSEAHRYVIGVQLECNGRGGSRALQQRMRVGSVVKLTAPRNDFVLAPSGEHILIGGGIGLTPMLAMAQEARARNQPFHLHVCTRSPQRTPFKELIADLAASGHVSIQHSDAGAAIDLPAVLKDAAADRHVYCCGPTPLIQAVVAAAHGMAPLTAG